MQNGDVEAGIDEDEKVIIVPNALQCGGENDEARFEPVGAPKASPITGKKGRRVGEETSGADLSTTDRPDFSDFVWYLDDVMYNGVPEQLARRARAMLSFEERQGHEKSRDEEVREGECQTFHIGSGLG